MAVIREDVVSIVFEVGDNPFAELTAGINEIKAKLGILDAAEGGLDGVSEGARTAANGVDSLNGSLRETAGNNDLAGPLDEAGDAAGEAGDRVSDLNSDLQDVGRQRLTGGIDDLSSGMGDPIGKFKDLAGQAKKFAKEKLDAGVAKLPPNLQLGIKAAGKLLGTLGKVAKITFKAVASGVKSIATHAAGAAKSLGKASFKGLATGITVASVAAAGLGTAAINVGAEFEASMSQVAATMGMTADEADYSNERYAKLANTAKAMGASTKFSASESAEALNYMALAGYDADKACAALPTVLNLAASGGMDLAAASDMVTDSMSALGIEATQENLEKFGDQLAKTAQRSNTSVAQLGEAVLTVGGTAKNLAGGTTELNTLLGIIADNGVKGAEGGTALRNIMLSLQSPTDVAAKKMRALGLNVYDAEGKMRPMNDILTDLSTSMDGMTDQQKQDAMSTIFNKRDLKSVSALLAGTATTTSQLKTALVEADYDVAGLGVSLDELVAGFDKAQGQEEFAANAMRDFGMTSDQAGVLFTGLSSIAGGTATRFNELSGDIENSGGAMADMADTMNDNLTGRITELKSATEGAGIAVFEAIGSGNLKGLVKEATGWVTELTRATEEGGLEGLVSQLGVTLPEVLATVAGYLPQLIQCGVSIVQSLLSGIIQNRGQIAQSLSSGLTTMLMGILQMAPQLLTAGILLLGSLLQGIEQQLPTILEAGLTAIQELCAGLVANGPAIIQSGINIILQLLNGLIAAAPTILTAGIQLVIMLAQGLIGAIPQLIQAIPQIIAAIITTLMSVNWLKLGLDIIKGIGNGLVQGIKGLFSKGKDAGKEVGDGVAAGLDESTSGLAEAAGGTADGAAEGFKPDTALLSEYGMQMPEAVASGIDGNAALVTDAAMDLGASTSEALTGAFQGTADGTQPSMDAIASSFDGMLSDMNLSAGSQMSQMDMAVQGGFSSMVTDAGGFRSDFKGEIDQTDLYPSGVDIMQGLDDGMNSMRGTLMATAEGIAAGIKDTVNGALDIHSPSRVMEESGEYTGLGLVKGMQNLEGKVARTARGIADQAASSMSPMRSRYSPDSAAVPVSQPGSQVNTWNPVFNLTLNGASASDSNERKVRRWVKDAIKESYEGIGRTNPRLQEV